MRTSSGINQSEHVDRARRVAEFVQREISDLIKTEFDDPRFELVTVTDVRLSKDLKYGRVFVSKADVITGLRSQTEDKGLSGEKSGGNHGSGSAQVNAAGRDKRASASDRAEPDQPDYVDALNRASARIRRLLAKRMTTKTTPKLQFEFDRVLDQGHRISSILDSVASDPTPEPVR